MRLINTTTLELEEPDDDRIPPYAILSHTWGPDYEELSFSDVKNGMIDKPGIGSIKFRECCKQAKESSINYAWIDTCCIDKTNLVELGEAINSMFRWYSLAKVCYAYLSDVPEGDDPSDQGSKFRTSRWFKRGWTLQELLAPKHLRFYNSKWNCIGTKGSRSTLIQEITRVPRQFLLGITALHTASVAQRMSWAAQRKTKRPEDLAYCLLGIFGIAMPMIYGEGGKKAFFRLQEQIMKTTRDDSILAWGINTKLSTSNPPQFADGNTFIYGDILAGTPADFEHSWQVTTREQATNPLHSLDIYGGSLRAYLPLLTMDTGETFGLLSCGPKSDTQQVVAIPLAKINSAIENEFVRPKGSLAVLRPVPTSDISPKPIHIKNDSQSNVSLKEQQYLFYEQDSFTKIGLLLTDVFPRACWNDKASLISQTNGLDGIVDQIIIRVQGKEQPLNFVIMIDFHESNSRINLLCCVFTCHKKTALQELAGKFQRKTLEAFRQTSASNGSLHLHIQLEPVERNITSIIPESIIRLPDYTVNATMALENPGLVLEPIQLLWEMKQNDGKIRSLYENITAQIISLESIEAKVSHLKGIEENFLSEYTKYSFLLKSIESEMIVFGYMREEHQHKRRMILEYEEAKKWPDGILEQMRSIRDTYDKAKERRDKIFEQVNSIGEEHQHGKQRKPKRRFDNERMMIIVEYEEAKKRRDEILERMRSFHDKYADAKERQDKILEKIEYFQKKHANARERQDEVFEQVRSSQDEYAKAKERQNKMREEMEYFQKEYAKVKERQREILEQVVHAQERLKELYRTEGCQDGWTPFRSAMAIGDIGMMDLLFDEHTDIMAQDKGLLPWIAASRNGNADAIKSLLGTDESELDHKDSIFGRTPLSWATANGHEDVVKLLLDTNKVDIHSKDNHGRTPLRWTFDRGHYNMLQVLLRQQNGFTLIHTLQGHEYDVHSVAFSHDSKLLASASKDCAVKLWDITTGKCIHRLQGYEYGVHSVAFSHDAKLLASASKDCAVKLWDTVTGECIHTLQGHKYDVYLVAFSHNSKLLASADDVVKLWNTVTGKCIHTLQVHEPSVHSVAFSHDSKLLASAGLVIELWNTVTGKCIRALQGYKLRIHSVAFSHNSKLLGSGSDDGAIKLWNTVTGECMHTLQGYEDAVCSVIFSPNPNILASRSGTAIKLWDTTTGKCIHSFQHPHNDTVAFSHDLKLLASPAEDGTIPLWDTSIIHDLATSIGYRYSLEAIIKDYNKQMENKT